MCVHVLFINSDNYYHGNAVEGFSALMDNVCMLCLNYYNHCCVNIVDRFSVLWFVLMIIELPPEELGVLPYDNS